MSDENPYSPPLSNELPVRPRRTHVGPVLSGLIAIVIATILSRGRLLIPAILGVGSWWLYKFWPRKIAPDDVGVRTFLEQLEHAPTIEDDGRKAVESDSPEQPIDELRNIRL
jgi:hypothetical protein